MHMVKKYQDVYVYCILIIKCRSLSSIHVHSTLLGPNLVSDRFNVAFVVVVVVDPRNLPLKFG